MPRTYVDNKMNRELGRVGLPHGSAVHSSSSSRSSSSSGYGSSHRTYVDNPMNRSLGRVGLEHGTAVHSRSDTPTSVGSPARETAVHSTSHRTYVDNPMNRSLGRVGLEHGTAVHSRSDTPTSVGSPARETAVHSTHETSKTYVDNPLNRSLGRVGKPVGTAVHSKGSEKQKSSNGCEVNQLLAGVVTQHSDSSVNPEMKVYVDNAYNRKLNRVGLPLGSVPVSRKNVLYQSSCLKLKQQEQSAVNSNENGCSTQATKVYVDNPFNRKHNRVGLPLGSVPISRKKKLYTESPLKRKQHTVGKPWGTPTGRANKSAALYTHLEEHPDEEIPPEFEDMPDDSFYYVLERKQRDKAVAKLLEETPDNDWQRLEHTLKTIKKYKGQIIDYKTLKMISAIGHGGFGEVHLASLESGEAVAVKMLKCQQVTKQRLQLFINEMDLFLKLDHPNIVYFVGACIEVPNLAIVMELMDMSLFDALHVTTVDFSVDNKLEITKGVTKGVAYLHSKNIAHCDLKTRNVLLINVPGEELTDDSKPVQAKITDFGLSKMKSDMVTSNSCSTKNMGTPLYSAPEIHRGELLSLEDLKKADVFSVGLVIWELAVEEIPFEDLTPQQLKVHVGEKGLTPTPSLPLRLDGKLQATLSLCWSMKPYERPRAETLAEIASTFTDLLDEREE